ncbi:hypothetical protein MLD38_021230 [Melastoma candidum]|uniref:Uncharacterized protein n=1 Tax=Melastoma candidum TaxID=119954 RepID=A0ACB9QNJ9_9MYRT|nr:hypothetical protein MLD38_021230 [Melastoma candidum]
MMMMMQKNVLREQPEATTTGLGKEKENAEQKLGDMKFLLPPMLNLLFPPPTSGTFPLPDKLFPPRMPYVFPLLPSLYRIPILPPLPQLPPSPSLLSRSHRCHS